VCGRRLSHSAYHTASLSLWVRRVLLRWVCGLGPSLALRGGRAGRGGAGAAFGCSDKNRKLIAKEGGVDLVLDCLRNGGGSPDLLLAASWAISNISAFGPSKRVTAEVVCVCL
jgi:hypothetical protein